MANRNRATKLGVRHGSQIIGISEIRYAHG
jgi:hypothetical protein